MLAAFGSLGRVGLAKHKVGNLYIGPGNINSGANVWYGLRGYNAAYAVTGTGKAVNVRRDSDNATQDIVILPNGHIDMATLITFAGVANLFVTKWYDQSGNGADLTQITAANQPSFLLDVGDGLPGVSFNQTASNQGFNPATITSTSLTYLSGVVKRTTVGNFPSFISQYDAVLNTSGNNLGWNSTVANSARIDSSAQIVATMSDNAFHSIQGLIASASSVLNIDGTETTGNAGAGVTYTKVIIGSYMTNGGASLPQAMVGVIREAGGWAATPNSTIRAAIHTNASVFWGTP
jgi:alpha-L-arabinofuranosidase B-like protein